MSENNEIKYSVSPEGKKFLIPKQEEYAAELKQVEEKVKKAMAGAFMDGNLSITEYQEIMNTEADTHMRKKFGDSSKKNPEQESDKDKKH